jgi:hypothetical protein
MTGFVHAIADAATPIIAARRTLLERFTIDLLAAGTRCKMGVRGCKAEATSAYACVPNLAGREMECLVERRLANDGRERIKGAHTRAIELFASELVPPAQSGGVTASI